MKRPIIDPDLITEANSIYAQTLTSKLLEFNKYIQYLEKAKRSEFIICSAVLYEDGKEHNHQPVNIKTGFVVPGRRHSNCYATVEALVSDLTNNIDFRKALAKMETREHQGFITNTDRFVTRKEAMVIAKQAHQLLHPELHDESNPDSELTSEDLF